jgi:hypothetical protein
MFQRIGVPLWLACSLAAALWVLLGLPRGHAAGSIMSGISTATLLYFTLLYFALLCFTLYFTLYFTLLYLALLCFAAS